MYSRDDFVCANKRRQGGKVEIQVDLSEQPLVCGLEAGKVEEVVIAVVRATSNQEQQDASQKC